jgi:hypothetical protein
MIFDILTLIVFYPAILAAVGAAAGGAIKLIKILQEA